MSVARRNPQLVHHEDEGSDRQEMARLRAEVASVRAELAQLRASLPDLIATALAVSGQRSAPSAPAVKSRADLKSAERTAILAALEAHAWNKTAAAAAVGMPIRTFYRRCEEYGIE